MKPIICPHCNKEVIPHETFRQRFEDCWEHSQKYPADIQLKMFEVYFNNLCLDLRTDVIQENKERNMKLMNQYKRGG